MANRPITITGIDGNGKLILSDNGNTIAKPGDTITWIIGQNSGVSAITGITDNSAPINVFNSDLGPVANSSNWQGTIKPDINTFTEEDYTILFDTERGESGSFDPKIQVNP